MEKNSNNNLQSMLDSSGFPLQIGIEYQIRTKLSIEYPGWEIVSTEHPWKDEQSGENGFIDLIIQNGWSRLVVECKRPRDGVWLFLLSDKYTNIIPARCFWTETLGDAKGIFGIHDFGVTPRSYESDVCIIRGQGENDKSLLERISGQLILATQSFAQETLNYDNKISVSYPFIYLPVIVTTARLHVCKIDPGKISLIDGKVENPEYEEVPFIRFRKSLATEKLPNSKISNIDEMRQDKERTILIANANSFIDMLHECSINGPIKWGPTPWEVVRNFKK